jgi:hypothetical protein
MIQLLPFPLIVMGVMAKAVLAKATAVASVLEDLMMLIADARKVVLMNKLKDQDRVENESSKGLQVVVDDVEGMSVSVEVVRKECKCKCKMEGKEGAKGKENKRKSNSIESTTSTHPVSPSNA